MISQHLPKGWQDKADELGIRFGTRHGAKLKNVEQLMQIFLHQVAHDLSLESATCWGAAAGLPSISSVALHKRVRSLGPLLNWILGELVGSSSEYVPEKWGGYELRVVDGTTVVRPGDDRATARILYVMRLSDLRLNEVHVSDDKVGETFSRLEDVRPDVLFIADRAYSSPPGIVSLCERGGDALVRCNWASLPLYTSDEEPFSVFDHLSKVSGKRPREWDVKIRSGPTWIPGRLVVQALPKDAAAKARGRLKQDKAHPSKNSLTAAGYRMVFTTAPADRLPATAVIALYPLRWQVELQIKRDKSIFGLKHLPNFRLDTIEAWLYAKLILAHLTRRLADEAIEDIPPCEAHASRAA